MNLQSLRPATEFAQRCGIYAIYNKSNNKLYIGSAVDLARRCRRHKENLIRNRHPNKHLQAAWNLATIDFAFLVLETMNDKAKLLEREAYYIALYRASEKECGYNKRIIPNSNLGLKIHSDENKRAISNRMKGHSYSKGRKETEENKKKASIRMKGKVWTPEQIEKRASKWRGKPRSEELKKILSEKSKGNKNALGHRLSEDIKENMRRRDKWPHGCICDCEECRELKRQLRSERHFREYYNANV